MPVNGRNSGRKVANCCDSRKFYDTCTRKASLFFLEKESSILQKDTVEHLFFFRILWGKKFQNYNKASRRSRGQHSVYIINLWFSTVVPRIRDESRGVTWAQNSLADPKFPPERFVAFRFRILQFSFTLHTRKYIFFLSSCV